LHGRRFPSDDDLQSDVCKLVHTIPKDWFAVSIRKLPERWQWCSDLSGEYAEVWLCGCHHLSACISGESQSFLNDPCTMCVALEQAK
jgi:hypothetical protein